MHQSKKACWLAVCPILSLGIAGCMPVTGQYYKPTAGQGHTASYSHCGPSDTLVLERNEVTIRVTSYFLTAKLPAPEGNSIGVEFRVPESRVVTFRPDGFAVVAAAGTQIVHIAVQAVLAPGKGSAVPAANGDVSLHGDAHRLDGQHYSEYTARITFAGSIPQQFELTVPAMNISGETFPDLPVRFAREHATWVAGIQCP